MTDLDTHTRPPFGSHPSGSHRSGPLERGVVRAHSWWLAREEGQATAEYGLVIVAAAGIAAALIVFGKSAFGAFFSRVLDTVVSQVR